MLDRGIDGREKFDPGVARKVHGSGRLAEQEARFGDVHVELFGVPLRDAVDDNVDRRLAVVRMKAQELLLHGPRPRPFRKGDKPGGGVSQLVGSVIAESDRSRLQARWIDGRDRRHLLDAELLGAGRRDRQGGRKGHDTKRDHGGLLQ
jgi:hypothetical protein